MRKGARRRAEGLPACQRRRTDTSALLRAGGRRGLRGRLRARSGRGLPDRRTRPAAGGKDRREGGPSAARGGGDVQPEGIAGRRGGEAARSGRGLEVRAYNVYGVQWSCRDVTTGGPCAEWTRRARAGGELLHGARRSEGLERDRERRRLQGDRARRQEARGNGVRGAVRSGEPRRSRGCRVLLRRECWRAGRLRCPVRVRQAPVAGGRERDDRRARQTASGRRSIARRSGRSRLPTRSSTSTRCRCRGRPRSQARRKRRPRRHTRHAVRRSTAAAR